MTSTYLNSAIRQFEYYKSLAEKAIAQLDEADLFFRQHDHSNSIAQLVTHISGNMLSRFTDFLTTDGEKSWRNRDGEFDENMVDWPTLNAVWDSGWSVLFDTLRGLQYDDLERIVFIRNEGHTVTEAINRQLCHYSYHIGQIIFIAKQLLADRWQTLSIAPKESAVYNAKKFSNPKQLRHFTDGL